MVRVGRNWVGPIQIALTLLGFPYCLCISGISVFTMPSSAPHSKARCPKYPGSETEQFPVPDDKVDWKTDWPQYSPVSYTATSVLIKPVWFILSLLYVSPPYRWTRDSAGQQVSRPVSKLPVLQFVSILRRDCGEWAIPGGMVDPGELVSLTLQCEFSEEALNSLAASSQDRDVLGFDINHVYNDYVDNPRNNDNSWMETVAVNFHDDTGISMISLIILQTLINNNELPMQVGDDAGQVHWIDLDSVPIPLCKPLHFLEVIAKERHAHW
uniref:Nudix (nucleoside diphosphate linked moiety X)-type motif 9 n=1 Tax=Oncorhynchus kisutch TaxID=8019 RepID=A0A8C7HHA4_ONCKI